jgi:hypothetical protein
MPKSRRRPCAKGKKAKTKSPPRPGAEESSVLVEHDPAGDVRPDAACTATGHAMAHVRRVPVAYGGCILRTARSYPGETNRTGNAPHRAHTRRADRTCNSRSSRSRPGT